MTHLNQDFFCSKIPRLHFMVWQPFTYIVLHKFYFSFYKWSTGFVLTYILILFLFCSRNVSTWMEFPDIFILSSTWLPLRWSHVPAKITPRGECPIWNTRGRFSSPWDCPTSSLVTQMYILNIILLTLFTFVAESRALVTQDRNEMVLSHRWFSFHFRIHIQVHLLSIA